MYGTTIPVVMALVPAILTAQYFLTMHQHTWVSCPKNVSDMYSGLGTNNIMSILSIEHIKTSQPDPFNIISGLFIICAYFKARNPFIRLCLIMVVLHSLTGITAIVTILNNFALLGCTLIGSMWHQHAQVLVAACNNLQGIPLSTLHGGGGSVSGAGSKNISAPSASQPTSTDKNTSTKRLRDVIDGSPSGSGDESDNRPPAKRGRPSKYHPEKICESCSIWVQTGNDKNLQKYHISDKMRHPGEHAEGMSNFVSTQDYNIVLQSDTCICPSCFTDYTRFMGTSETPRWLKLKNSFYCQQHCIFCCTDAEHGCICKQISEWSPTQLSDDDLKL